MPSLTDDAWFADRAPGNGRLIGGPNEPPTPLAGNKVYFEVQFNGYDNNHPTSGDKLTHGCFGIADASFQLYAQDTGPLYDPDNPDVPTSGVHLANIGTKINAIHSLFFVGSNETDSYFGGLGFTQSWGWPNALNTSGFTSLKLDWFGIALDLDNSLLWITNITRGAGVWWGSSDGVGDPDPSSGNRGFDYSSNLTPPIYLLAGTSKDSNFAAPFASVVLNAGHTSFLGTIPDGWTPWDDTGATTWSSGDNSYQNLSNGDLTITGGNNPVVVPAEPAFFCRSTTTQSPS